MTGRFLALALAAACAAASGADGSAMPRPSAWHELPPGWGIGLQSTSDIAQQAALQDGRIAVIRTADDRLQLCVPLDAASDGLRPGPRVTAFLRTLVAPMTLHPGMTMVLRETGLDALRPQPGARAVLRYLVVAGVPAGRIAIDLGQDPDRDQPAPPECEAVRSLRMTLEDGTIGP